jgi:transposase
MSRRQAAAHFQVGVSSAIRWAAQVEKSGDLSPKPQGGDRLSAAIEAQADTILSLLAAAPDITLMELQADLAEKGHRFSVSTIWRFFARRKIPLKKKSAHAAEQERPGILKRREAWFAGIPPPRAALRTG